MKKLFLLMVFAGISINFFGCIAAEENGSKKASDIEKNTNRAETESASPAPVEMTREEFDKDKPRYRKEAKELGSAVGDGANDLWLWTKLNAEFAKDERFADSKITIDVNGEVVTLRGIVSTKQIRSDAVKLANGVEGVKEVKDLLNVETGQPPDDPGLVKDGKSDADRTNANDK